ncbi:MAG: hypothetical protein KY468_01860 [Armatimonadetes bacterium]|nr:hypothetical protein [Armatimonadota bacterium]
MTCTQFQESIPALLSGSAKVSPEAAAHLARCARCGEEMEAYSRTLLALKELRPPVSSPVEASLARIQEVIAPATESPGSVRRRAGIPLYRRLFRPGYWHWSAQFVAAVLMGGLAGVWLLHSWRVQDADPLRLPTGLEAGLPPVRAWTGGTYDRGTGPVDSLPTLEDEIERTRWKANLGYVRLEDQLDSIFKELPRVRYYLHPDLKNARIAPLEMTEAVPFSEFLQHLAHASNLTVRKNAAGREILVRNEGARMYRRGPVYYFVPKQENIAPITTDLYRAAQLYWP